MPEYVAKAAIFRGVAGTNEWDDGPTLVESAHTHATSFSAWTLTRERAVQMYAAVRKRIHPKKDILTCPSCFRLKGTPALIFVDIGESLRGPMCSECLHTFQSNNPARGGYPLFVFRKANMGKIPMDLVEKETVTAVSTLRSIPVVLKNLV